MKSKLINRFKRFREESKPLKNKFQKVSYSQTGEDLIVDFIFKHIGIPRPSYIDIGAHHPFYLSNTALFYEKGCKGLNIEPDPALFKLFPKYRANDCNLNVGIGTASGNADFYIISSSTLNTFSKKTAESYINEGDFPIVDIVNIKLDTVANIIEEHNKGIFPQFLNIDAEGIDELILRSINYEKNYPLVICVETLSFSTSGNGLKNAAIIDLLKNKDYMLYADNNINSIFVRNDVWHK